MTIVALVTTGKAEEAGLASWLGRLFPKVQFRTERSDGFTSRRLLQQFDRPPTDAMKLAARLVAAVDPGRKIKSEKRADFAFAIEDVELFNADQPKRVVEVFRDAVKAHLNGSRPIDQSTQKTFEKLKVQASFHLLSPMLEAYFFGDPNAIEAIGIDRAAPKIKSGDLEHFATDDENYTVAISPLPNKPQQAGKSWTAVEWYPRHPKEYCNYLLDPMSPYEPKARIYKEVNHGVNALTAMDANTVLANETQQRFLRAFINDLANALDREPFAGDTHPLTGGSGGLLRNI